MWQVPGRVTSVVVTGNWNTVEVPDSVPLTETVALILSTTHIAEAFK
jgi:hypothetical protein